MGKKDYFEETQSFICSQIFTACLLNAKCSSRLGDSAMCNQTSLCHSGGKEEASLISSENVAVALT